MLKCISCFLLILFILKYFCLVLQLVVRLQWSHFIYSVARKILLVMFQAVSKVIQRFKLFFFIV